MCWVLMLNRLYSKFNAIALLQYSGHDMDLTQIHIMIACMQSQWGWINFH